MSTLRGRPRHHPRSVGTFTQTSEPAHVNIGALRHLDDIVRRAILLITGDQAHSRYFSEDIPAQASGPSELLVVAGAATSTCTTAATPAGTNHVPDLSSA